ncbi:MAG TPA: SWIM zinc finger family protein, partial [Fimbriimonas sp.]|nr:SWIM zinc finger family protein [Fimbriimonas sp.]
MTMVRAREYERAGKVLQARLSEDGWIYGRVRGEAISPYEQVIALEKNGVGFAVSGECSCPAGFNCKHVAAVLIRLMRTGNVEIDSRRRSPLAPTNAPVERWLASVRDASAPTNDFPAGIQQRLLYVLDFDTEQDRHLPLVHVLSARLQPNGEWQRATPYKAASLGAQQYAKYLRPIDIRLLKSMQHMLRPHAHTELIYELAGPDAARILEELVETSRCHWSDISTAPLSRGPSLDAKPLWIEGPAGEQRFGLEGVESLVLPVAPPWYLDRASNKCGPIETGLDRNIAAAMLGAPKVLPEHSRRVRSELAELFGSNPELLPKAMRPPSLVTEKPEPHLHIGWASSRYAFSQFPNETVPRVPYARLEFKYGEVLTNGPGAEVRATEHGQPVVYIRDHKQEQEFWDELVQAGWVRSQMQRFWEVPPAHRSDAVMVPESGGLNACDLEQRLFQFIHRSVPKLEEKGWVLEFDDGLSGDVESRLKLSAKLSDVGSDTFDFSIEGFDSSHTYDLRPALESARGMLQRDEKERGGYVYQWLDNGKILAVEADRLLPLLAGLIGVFGDRTKWEGQLKIPGYRTVELAGLSGAFDDWRAPDK